MASWRVLAPLGALLASLGASWRALGASCRALGVSWPLLGRSWAVLGRKKLEQKNLAIMERGARSQRDLQALQAANNKDAKHQQSILVVLAPLGPLLAAPGALLGAIFVSRGPPLGTL